MDRGGNVNQSEQDERLAQYLLGALPEAEELRIEAAYLADADAQERLAVVEDELVDAYVRHQLRRADCHKLEARFLASPRGRKKLELARSLLALTREAAPIRRSVNRGWLGLAAAAAGAAVIGFLILGSRQPTPEPTAFAMLEPGLGRGAGAIKRVHIPAGATELTLELRLDTDRHAAYRAELLGSGDRVLWSAGGLESRNLRGGSRGISLRVPAGLLGNADYTILLSPDEAGATPVAEYGFGVR